jgi:hypothetical protein
MHTQLHTIPFLRRVKNMLVGMLVALAMYSVYSDVVFAVRVQASASDNIELSQ